MVWFARASMERRSCRVGRPSRDAKPWRLQTPVASGAGEVVLLFCAPPPPSGSRRSSRRPGCRPARGGEGAFPARPQVPDDVRGTVAACHQVFPPSLCWFLVFGACPFCLLLLAAVLVGPSVSRGVSVAWDGCSSVDPLCSVCLGGARPPGIMYTRSRVPAAASLCLPLLLPLPPSLHVGCTAPLH